MVVKCVVILFENILCIYSFYIGLLSEPMMLFLAVRDTGSSTSKGSRQFKIPDILLKIRILGGSDDNFWQFWQFLTILTILIILIILIILTILAVLDNFYNYNYNFDNDNDNHRDVWPLRQWLQFWLLRTWIYYHRRCS